MNSVVFFLFEVATLLSLPNQNLAFVQSILKDTVVLVADEGEKDYSTAGFYFLSRNGVHSALAVNLLAESGSSNLLLQEGIKRAAQSAAIVINPLGPPSEAVCTQMKSFPHVVFLMGIGSTAGRNDPSEYPSCASPNILVVSGLNKNLDDLASNQTMSSLIRVTGPYMDLKAPVDHQRELTMSSRYFTMAMVAGKLAQILRANPQLSGAHLVDKFLAEETVELPKLQGKVGLPKALLNVVY